MPNIYNFEICACLKNVCSFFIYIIPTNLFYNYSLVSNNYFFIYPKIYLLFILLAIQLVNLKIVLEDNIRNMIVENIHSTLQKIHT